MRSTLTSKDGTSAAVTDQTSTSFSNAVKFLCANQAGTTAAVMCGITGADTEKKTTNSSSAGKINVLYTVMRLLRPRHLRP